MCSEYKEDLTYRLRKRAEIRRSIPHRKSVINNEPDRLADLLEEAANFIETLGWRSEYMEKNYANVEVIREEQVQGTVFISVEEYNRLMDDSAELAALYEAGVDNWEGYSEVV